MWHGGFEPTCLFLFKEMLLISEKNPNKTTTAKKKTNRIVVLEHGSQARYRIRHGGSWNW